MLPLNTCLQVAEWTSSIQALALSFNSSEATERQESPRPSPLGRAPSPSYDLGNANALASLDPFRDFQSPEALRASSSNKPAAIPSRLAIPEQHVHDLSSPLPAVSPVLPSYVASSGMAHCNTQHAASASSF